MKKITVLLADDHKLVRDAWAHMLSTDSRFEVSGTASTGEEAVELTGSLNPDVVLMDINMGEVSGFEATKQIKSNSPATKVIGVSMHSMPAYAKKCLNWVRKGTSPKNSDKRRIDPFNPGSA
ncbi:MAG: response regulator transcription factor [Bacteroidia bacterium]|nr:response regulator transcription factor [Bacteroidia bacterium]